jgi:hypothetical protein
LCFEIGHNRIWLENIFPINYLRVIFHFSSRTTKIFIDLSSISLPLKKKSDFPPIQNSKVVVGSFRACPCLILGPGVPFQRIHALDEKFSE